MLIGMTDQNSSTPLRVFVLGATGTVGRATVAAMVAQGHRVVCLVRNRSGVNGAWDPQGAQ